MTFLPRDQVTSKKLNKNDKKLSTTAFEYYL